MGQGDELDDDARASMGELIEPLLRGDQKSELCSAGTERSLSQVIAEVDTAEGRERVKSYLSKRPFPHYTPVAGQADLFRRIEADGSEVVGRFVGSEFVPVDVDC
jgi:hypothetical protein